MIVARAGICACPTLLLAVLTLSGGGCGGGARTGPGPADPNGDSGAASVPAGSLAPSLPATPETFPAVTDSPGSSDSPGPASYPSNLYVEHDVRVTARRGGVIDRVLVDRGATVRAGQPMAGIEADEATQELAVAVAEERFARAETDRMVPLAGEKIVSPQDLLRAETALDRMVARSALARTILERCTVKAPFDGVVIERWAIVGQRVTDEIDSPPLFRVVAREPYRARVDLPEAELAGIRPGSAATVVAEGAGGPFEVGARVAYVGSAVDAASGTAPVIVQVTGAAGSLRLGSAVSVRFAPMGAASGRKVPLKVEPGVEPEVRP